MDHSQRRGALLLSMLGLPLLCLTACTQTPDGGTIGTTASGTPGGDGVLTDRGGSATPGAPGPTNNADPMRRAWTLLSQWDAAQTAGQRAVTDRTASDLQRTVDGNFAAFVAASNGEKSVELQYLSTSVLGFSGNPGATRVLEERLNARDPGLVANALVALALRKDPGTNMASVLRWADQRAPDLPRRYAPLVISAVIDARLQAGQQRDVPLEADAFRRMGGLISDRDAVTRLHVAKALGSIRNPGTTDYLTTLMQDKQTRVRWAAAAALQKGGDARGFREVMRLLHETPDGSKHIIQDILVSYAGRLKGQPLSAATIAELGTNTAQWSRWFSTFQREQGIRVPPSRT